LYFLDHYGYAVELIRARTLEVDALLRKNVRWVLIPIEDNRPRLAEWQTYFDARGKLTARDPEFLIYRL
jgi:hypothetical protein